ncbi:MAG: exodeoxyribonuclease III [Candidatus Woesearchaeota archaeon]|jgi:exodeoxyribonuclease-3|nr:exodeoxyribonuclease III [Candidatus Woesearchaeota archaeon]
MEQLKLVSWNVNGIRAIMKKDFLDSIKEMNPDVFCLQETKAHPDQLEHELEVLGYKYEYWNSAEKKGYSGTAIFSKLEPVNVSYGLGIEEHDTEGRVITAEFEKFFLVTVYTPNSKRELERLDYRYEKWDIDFLTHVKKLEQIKPVIFCGDLNAAHKEIDIKNDKSNMTTKTKPGSAGFTDKEREGIDNIIAAGFIDTFRLFNPEKEQYTWWTYMFGARGNNVGWRIDYFFTSNLLKGNLTNAQIRDEVMGSDHCPVELEIKF